MARYRALQIGFVGGGKIRVGQEFTWNGPPADWMEPVDEAAKAAAASAPVRRPEPAPAPVSSTDGPDDPFKDMPVEKMLDYVKTKSGRDAPPKVAADEDKLRNLCRTLAGSNG